VMIFGIPGIEFNCSYKVASLVTRCRFVCFFIPGIFFAILIIIDFSLLSLYGSGLAIISKACAPSLNEDSFQGNTP